jgi:hypothetical protein
MWLFILLFIACLLLIRFAIFISGAKAESRLAKIARAAIWVICFTLLAFIGYVYIANGGVTNCRYNVLRYSDCEAKL